MRSEQYECPECGAQVDEGVEMCPDCGVEFLSEDEEDSEYEEYTESDYVEDEERPNEEDETEPLVREVDPEEMFAAEGVEEPTPTGRPGRPLSLAGMVFAVLAVVCVVGLLVVLNYDTWIAGEEENNIGDTQMMYVYLAAAAVVACVAVAAFDLVRNRGMTSS